MRHLTEHDLTDAILARLRECDDPRLKQVMAYLMKHLHGFSRDIGPTPQERIARLHFFVLEPAA